MSVESKMKFRAYASIAGGFVVLSFIVGITYAFLTALLAVLLWNAYKWLKLMRWWRRESPLTRQMIEHISAQLNEGTKSKNVWVGSLTLPEMANYAKDYRVELIARPMMIEKESKNLAEGWTDWAASRLEEYVLKVPTEELEKNVGSKDHPILMGRVLIARVAFEILVAEHALRLLNIPDPRATIARRTLAPQLERINAGRSEGNLGQQLIDAAYAEAFSSALNALALELGEEQTQRK
jgi:hypothetical protein